jgi:hypothetical protein
MEMECFVHSVSGRLRVKIPGLRNRPQAGNFIVSLFSDMKGIYRIFNNTVTGSVVINYDPELVQESQILELLKENNFIAESDLRADHKHVGQNASRAGVALGKAIVGWTVGRALENSGLSFLAALI